MHENILECWTCWLFLFSVWFQVFPCYSCPLTFDTKRTRKRHRLKFHSNSIEVQNMAVVYSWCWMFSCFRVGLSVKSLLYQESSVLALGNMDWTLLSSYKCFVITLYSLLYQESSVLVLGNMYWILLSFFINVLSQPCSLCYIKKALC